MVNFYKPKTVKKNINQQLTVEIQRLDINGDGVARHGKKPIFVELALPGETVEVKVTEEKSKYLRAKTKKVLVAASDRVTPVCKHFYQCGGCDLQHLDYDSQLAFKQHKIADLFRRNSNIEQLPWQSALHAEVWHYRRKARIGVQYNKLNQAIVGFRQKSSNVLTPIKSCSVLADVFADEFSDFTTLINSLSSKQAISHIEVISAEVPVVIFRQVRKLGKEDKQKLLEFNQQKPYQIALQLDNGLHYIEPQNDRYLSYQVNDCELQFTASDFVQVNTNLNSKMVKQAIRWLDLAPQDNILDLFCGLGNFSLPIAKQVNSVIGIEGVQDMVDRATMNAQANQLSNCQFYQADLNEEINDWPWLNTHSDNKINKIILDPARAGAYNAVKNIVELNVKTVLYISCDAATMARDAKVLLDNGFTLNKICLMDMFSHTRHVETMAMFNRC